MPKPDWSRKLSQPVDLDGQVLRALANLRAQLMSPENRSRLSRRRLFDGIVSSMSFATWRTRAVCHSRGVSWGTHSLPVDVVLTRPRRRRQSLPHLTGLHGPKRDRTPPSRCSALLV
jgi:hypothetical protein